MALLIDRHGARGTKAEIRNVTGLISCCAVMSQSRCPDRLVSFGNVTLGDDSKPVLAADRLTHGSGSSRCCRPRRDRRRVLCIRAST